MQHITVLLEEVINMIEPKDGGRYFDGTLGGGGHAELILNRCAPTGRLAGTDLDPAVIENLEQRFETYGERFAPFNNSFMEIDKVCLMMDWDELDGIILDLGLSSMAIDTPERGFSFSKEGPLDMRFSSKAELSAAEVVNDYSEQELSRIIKAYGEERFARKIARTIVESRPLSTTTQLAEVVSNAIPRRFWPERIHPATRTFQAIRMEVNNELGALEEFLPKAASLLKVGGTIAIISFHSLEDRIVKQFFNPKENIELRNMPIAPASDKPQFKIITRKPLLPTDDELAANPRSRSAKLRVARRVA